jgi:ELWxxDGT repeat protein
MSIKRHAQTLFLLFTLSLVPLLPNQATPARGQSPVQGPAELLIGTPEGEPTTSGFPANLSAEEARAFYTSSTEDGTSLWVSDGTPEGTRQLRNDLPYVERGIAVGTNYFFSTRPPDFNQPNMLWRSDGTPEGTVQVKAVGVVAMASFKGALYFMGENGLWRSDGSEAGTLRLATIRTDIAEGWNMAAAGERLFFSGCSYAFGCELWVSDGTPEGTRQLKDLVGGARSSFPRQFTPVGGRLFFSAIDANQNPALWVSDGSARGTVLLRRGPLSGGAALGNQLIFSVELNGALEIWRSNGSARGTARIAQLAGERPLGGDQALFNTGSQVFFVTQNDARSTLWRSDGSGQGTRELPGFNSVFPIGILGERLLFNGSKASTDQVGIWASDGSDQGTQFVTSIAAPTGAAGMSVGGRLLFAAFDAAHGNELWTSDGTPAGTRLLKDTVGSTVRSYPGDPVAVGERLIFNYYRSDLGFEPWASDGTITGTELLKDIAPGEQGYRTWNQLVAGERAFFNDIGSGDLWASDGTPEGTSLVWQTQGDEAIYPRGALGERLIFTTQTSLTTTLWIGDGSEQNSIPLLDNAPRGIESIQTTENRLFFRETLTDTTRIWASDGTPAGTRVLTQTASYSGIWSAATLAADDALLILPVDGTWLLLRSDGTAEGTRVVRSFAGALTGLTRLGELLYFAANDGEHGYELWATDGTPENTRMVVDLNPGPPSGFDSYRPFLCSIFQPELVVSGGKLFFPATDGATGLELFVSDGTAEGTRLLKDIDPRFQQWDTQRYDQSGFPYRITPRGDGVLFIADDGAHGKELWASDGTPEGTRLALDAKPGPASGLAYTTFLGGRICTVVLNYQPLVPLGDDLSFIADGNLGYGLYALRAGVDAYAAPAFSSATPGQIASVPVRLGNRRLDAATLTVSVRLDDGLAYLGDTSGISPTISGQTLSWTLPQFGVGARDFLLVLQAPDAPLGTRLAYELRVSAEGDADPSNDVATGELLISRRQLLPAILLSLRGAA